MHETTSAAGTRGALITILAVVAGCQGALSLGGLGKPAPGGPDRASAASSAAPGRTAGPAASHVDRGPPAGADHAAAAPDLGPSSGGIDWCGGRAIDLKGRSLTATTAWHDRGFTREKIFTIAYLGCSKRITEEERGEVRAAHAKLASWSQLPAAELRAYLHAVIATDEGPQPGACRALKARDPGTDGLAKLLGCEGAGKRVAEDEATSALGSAGVVHECLRADSAITELGELDATHLARYALCGAELRRLDRAALDRELEAAKVAPAARTEARLALRRIDTVAAGLDRYLAPRIERDPKLAAFYYKVPDRAFSLGEKANREGAEYIAAARDLEARAAKGPAQVAGCFEPLRALVLSRLKKARVATLDKIRYELRGPVGYQLSRALESCASFDGQRLLAQLVNAQLAGADDYRGPRTMVYWFLRDHLEKLGVDRTALPVPIEELERARVAIPRAPVRSAAGAPPHEFSGLVKQATEQSGAVRIEFQTLSRKVEQQVCEDTSKVHSIRADGTIVYHKKCGTPKMVTERLTPDPVLVAREHAAAIAPGRAVQMFCEIAGAPRRCVPVAVWKDKNRTALAAALGGPL
jgi:hypothetical protein